MLVEANVRIFQSEIWPVRIMQISFCLTLPHNKTANSWGEMRIIMEVIIFTEGPLYLSANQLVQQVKGE